MSLRFDATVDRRLVHKRALENVFVTDAVATGRTWRAAAQLPLMHRFHNEVAGRHDLLLVAEAARQCIATIAHQLMDVPLDSRFVITEMRIEARDDDALAVGGSEMVVDFSTQRERRRRDGRLRGFTGEARCLLVGKHVASFSGSVLFLPAQTYAAARDAEPGQAGLGRDEVGPAGLGQDGPGQDERRFPAERADPASVGRRDPANVMISPVTPAPGGGHQAFLAADTEHPVFFDHPQDHYPGMLLLEAGRQLAIARAVRGSGQPAAAFQLVSCAAAFADFAELGPPVLLEAAGSADQVAAGGAGQVAAGSAGQATIRVRQQGQQLAVLDIELRNTGLRNSGLMNTGPVNTGLMNGAVP